MDNFQDVDYDYGGVHINSGIPNHAFYVVALTIGGSAWERAGKIWYRTLMDGRLTARPSFQVAADLTHVIAGEEFGSGSREQQAVRTGWSAVGIQMTGADAEGEPRKDEEEDKDKGPGKKGCLVALATLGMIR